MATVDYTINGEKGCENCSEITTPEEILRKKQLFNYTISTAVQGMLAVMVLGSFFSSQVAMWNGNMEKWFTRHAVMLIGLGFIGVIAAIKANFKHYIKDSENN
jgi:hypothetical protein